MPMDGMPMPEAITVTGTPFQVPVWPCTPRTLFTSFGSVRKVSAMNLARSGSPGIRTVLAKSSFFALMCGVGIGMMVPPSIQIVWYDVSKV